MKKLLLIAIIALSGCSPAYNQYTNLHSAFYAGCKHASIVSSIATDNDTLTLTATCTRDK